MRNHYNNEFGFELLRLVLVEYGEHVLLAFPFGEAGVDVGVS